MFIRQLVALTGLVAAFSAPILLANTTFEDDNYDDEPETLRCKYDSYEVIEGGKRAIKPLSKPTWFSLPGYTRSGDRCPERYEYFWRTPSGDLKVTVYVNRPRANGRYIHR